SAGPAGRPHPYVSRSSRRAARSRHQPRQAERDLSASGIAAALSGADAARAAAVGGGQNRTWATIVLVEARRGIAPPHAARPEGRVTKLRKRDACRRVRSARWRKDCGVASEEF